MNYELSILVSAAVVHGYHYKKTVISSNFLGWKFCGKAQFPNSFRRFARNYPEIVPFDKIVTPVNLVKLRYFTQCILKNSCLIKIIKSSYEES